MLTEEERSRRLADRIDAIKAAKDFVTDKAGVLDQWERVMVVSACQDIHNGLYDLARSHMLLAAAQPSERSPGAVQRLPTSPPFDLESRKIILWLDVAALSPGPERPIIFGF